MIISHKYKFIFIKTRKTAGTSIETYLSKYCSESDIFTPLTPEEPGHQARNYRNIFKKQIFYNHMPAIEIKKAIGENIFNSYFKFCVERNPLDKCISYYSMFKNSPHHHLIENYTVDHFFSFNDFPKDFHKYTVNKKVVVDKILRYENLEEELEITLKLLGLKWKGFEGINAKSEFRERDCLSIFSDKHIEIIKNMFKEEIDLFGYQINQ